MKYLTVVVLFVFFALQAEAATYWVPATADIYLAGQPVGTVLSDSMNLGGADVAPAQAAFEATGIPIASGRFLTFSASGGADYMPNSRNFGPDGKADGLTSFNPYTGVGLYNGRQQNQASPVPFALSGHANMPIVALIGVFTSDTVPLWGTPSQLPPSLDYLQIGLSFQSFSPELRQVFFIGDGRTGGGVVQQFRVPVGATHLYLGINDGLGTYWGNPGGFTVAVTPVPEPSSILALLCGIGGLGGVIWRRKSA